jgi:hypothetical protein
MVKEDVSHCGLNCKKCKEKFGKIKKLGLELEIAMEEVNFKEVAKVIPMMKSKYKKHKKFMEFFKNDCPGCRKGGGNPFCAIRKCNTKKNYFTCAECGKGLCSRYKMLFKVHIDNEIQDNIKAIREKGIDKFISEINEKENLN